jgi:hypothetical protein
MKLSELSPTTLRDCPPGLFLYEGELGFKSEYSDESGPHAYCVSSGEFFWGRAKKPAERGALTVVPVSLA